MSVRDTQTIDLEWGGRLVFVNCIFHIPEFHYRRARFVLR